MEKIVKIGNVEIKRTVALAPMAGTADGAMREICRAFGACYTVGEMVSSKGLVHGGKKTMELLALSPAQRPAAIQLFGNEPDAMASATVLALEYQPDILDINMGCPAPKIAGNGGGSALMRDPALAARIIRAVVAQTTVPVTVKFRKGWDDEHVNAVDFAKMCEQCGAAAVTVHGRTRKQMYAPPVDIGVIAAVKHAVRIPVIANGDVADATSAVRMYRETGADLIMVGRGALGNPWVFSQIEAYLERGEQLPPPSLEERLAVMLRQIKLACLYKGEGTAMREARKHAAWYLTGVRGAAAFRRQAGTLLEFSDLERLAEDVRAAEAQGALRERPVNI